MVAELADCRERASGCQNRPDETSGSLLVRGGAVDRVIKIVPHDAVSDVVRADSLADPQGDPVPFTHVDRFSQVAEPCTGRSRQVNRPRQHLATHPDEMTEEPSDRRKRAAAATRAALDRLGDCASRAPGVVARLA